MGKLMIFDDELVAALQAAQDCSEDQTGGGMTSGELVKRLGKNITWVRQHLAEMKSDGRLEVVRRSIIGLDGRHMTVSAYRLKNGELGSPGT